MLTQTAGLLLPEPLDLITPKQNSKNTVGSDISTTDVVAVGTTTLTSATANFGTTIVGNIIYLQGGTGSLAAGWYQVISRSSTTTIVVDRNVGTGTGITMNVGGALLSPAISSSLAVLGNTIYIKNDGTAFSITSASVNIAGGAMSTGTYVTLLGYSTNRSPYNTDTQPTIQTNVTTATQVTGSSAYFMNITFDGNSQTSSKHSSSTTNTFINCMMKNFNTASSSGPVYIACQATTNSAVIFPSNSYYCEAYANTATPFTIALAYGCLSYGNTGGSTHGFSNTGTTSFLSNCISYGNGGNGFNFGSNASAISNCHAENNTGFGFVFGTGVKFSINNSVYNNTGGTVSNTATSYYPTGFITSAITSSVFTNAAGNVFNLNNTAGAGAVLRAAGFPALFPTGLTNNYRDIGAMQHKDPAASGALLINPGMTGGCSG